MSIAYLAIGILFGLAAAVWGWIAGLSMLAVLGLYTLSGSLGVVVATVTIVLKDGFRTRGVGTVAYPAE